LGHELHRTGGLDVLREHEHPDRGVGIADPPRGAQALVGEGRRHTHIDHGEIGIVLADGRAEAVGVAYGGDHLVAGVTEQPRETFAEERLVLGDD
jgi:hypothetical protein